LLTATNLKDAMDKITRPNQAAGHNYQLMEFNSKKIFNIEVASFNRFTIKELFVLQDQVQAFFHANQYQTLYVSQPEYPSSIHRLKRYSELKTPSNLQQALEILGDQEDHLYPIFHDEKSHARGELSGWTLFKIAFDLDKAIAYSYEGNPAKANIHLIWDLTNPSNITTIDT
jgi:hypothetical protein